MYVYFLVSAVTNIQIFLKISSKYALLKQLQKFIGDTLIDITQFYKYLEIF